MKHVIVRSGERFMVPLMLVVSVALLAKGHHAPGGGFAGGLLAATAFSLRAFARDPSPEDHPKGMTERLLLGAGLTLVAAMALWPVVAGKSVLEVVKTGVILPAKIHVDSSLLFETGIYLVSCGAGLTAIKSLLRRS